MILFGISKPLAQCTALAMLVSGCTVLGPNYERPATDIPADWASSSLAQAPQ
jgi:hypothetical protein